MELLDYANWAPDGRKYPRASEVRARGYEGTIRYVTSPGLMQPPNPGNKKHITEAEYREHTADGLLVLLVYQGGTMDPEGGYDAGRRNALQAVEGTFNGSPRQPNGPLGYLGPIFFANDKTTVNVRAWQDYLDGAASVIGIHRVGAYGFGNAMDAAVGHATWFWQAGRRSDVRGHVHIWQNNNIRVTVDGIVCDVNEVLKPLDIPMEDDLTPEQSDKLDAVFGSLYNTASTPYKMTIFDSLRVMEAKLDGLAGTLSDDEANIVRVVREGDSAVVSALLAEFAKIPTGGADPELIASKIVEAVGPELAGQILDGMGRALTRDTE